MSSRFARLVNAQVDKEKANPANPSKPGDPSTPSIADESQKKDETPTAEAASNRTNPSQPSYPAEPSNPSIPSNTTNPASTANPTKPAKTASPRHTPRTANPEKSASRANTSNSPNTPNPANPSYDIAPTRDFMRVANSITREALRAGMFTGKSKQLYDVLYARTRGAIVPKMSAMFPREHLMKAADISSTLTLRKNLMHLKHVGLISWQERPGVRGGNEYTVYLPEEVDPANPGQTSHHGQTSNPGQNLEGLDRIGTDPSTPGVTLASSMVYDRTNTSFNTNTTDDEVFGDLIRILAEANEKLVGKKPNRFSREKWAEVAKILVEELDEAALQTTDSVSSVPGLLAAHLRRKRLSVQRRSTNIAKSEIRQVNENPVPEQVAVEDEGPPIEVDIEDSISMFRELLSKDGYDLAKLSEQFAAGYSDQSWERILEELQRPD